MPQREINPPPRKPVGEYNTPNPADGYYTELLNRDDPAWQSQIPIPRGTPYSSIVGSDQRIIDLYAAVGGLYFLKAVKPGNSGDYGNSDRWLILFWATPFFAESATNAEITYMEESVAHPGFSRVYTIRRDTYEATPTIALGTPLTALLGVKITAGGTGYTAATITTGVAGTGATIQAVISDGVIVSAIVTAEGSGFTAASTIIITGDGTGATADAIIQPVTAILTIQKKQELGQDSPFSAEFVRVLRFYETLPGPVIAAKYYDPETDTLISETRQRVLESTANPPITSLYVDFKREPDSSFVTVFVARTYPSEVTSKTFTEFEPDHFTYPAILTGVSTSTIEDLNHNKYLILNPAIAAERPLLIAKKVVRTFTTTAPTDASLLSGIYQIQPYRHRYNGQFYNFATGPVLQDAGSIPYSTGTEDPTWGAGVNEDYSWTATTPSATDYLASRTAAEWKKVYVTSKKLAQSLYMIQSVHIPIL